MFQLLHMYNKLWLYKVRQQSLWTHPSQIDTQISHHRISSEGKLRIIEDNSCVPKCPTISLGLASFLLTVRLNSWDLIPPFSGWGINSFLTKVLCLLTRVRKSSAVCTPQEQLGSTTLNVTGMLPQRWTDLATGPASVPEQTTQSLEEGVQG